MVNKAKANVAGNKQYSQRSMISQIWNHHNTGPEDRTDERLFAEALTVTVAGTLATAWVLTVGFYYLVSQPATKSRLRKELTKISDPLNADMAQLEHLLYLGAVVKESLRLSYGAAG